jgi:hypothetical protein
MNDGRYIDPSVGVLAGEGSQQDVTEREKRLEHIAREAATYQPGAEPVSYYGLPVVKEPVWKWYIPAYFVSGGAAGAAAVLGAASQRRTELRGLVRKSRWIAAGGLGAGTVFLIADLGRPSRFANMLRVFRPTSPMNLGSWLLSAAAPASAAAAVLGETGATGLGDAAGVAAGILGAPLTTYTAVLTSNSAIPLWQQTRRSLPALYAGSAICAATSILELTNLSPAELRVVERYARWGKLTEIASSIAVEQDAKRVPGVEKPLSEGLSGSLWKASKACTAASLALSALPGKSPLKRRAAAVLGLAGSVGAKWAIFRAGFASARDPQATFAMQRAGHGGAETAR